MTELNSSRREFINKTKKEALTKLNFFRENFEKQKEERGADLEEAGKIWKEVSERFKWWGSLP